MDSCQGLLASAHSGLQWVARCSLQTHTHPHTHKLQLCRGPQIQAIKGGSKGAFHNNTHQTEGPVRWGDPPMHTRAVYKAHWAHATKDSLQHRTIAVTPNTITAVALSVFHLAAAWGTNSSYTAVHQKTGFNFQWQQGRNTKLCGGDVQ